MITTSIAETAGAARQRLAGALATLQQDPNVPPSILEIVSGLARAMGPLFQLERGSADHQLVFKARGALQDTLGAMQTADQSYPGVADATAAIAHSLGLIYNLIREHNLAEGAPAPVQSAAAFAPTAPIPATPLAPTTPLSPDATAPVPLVQPAAAPVPLVQPAAAPVPLVQPSVPHDAPRAAPVQPGASSRRRDTPRPSRMTVFPETAAKVPVGPNGLPRLEAALDVHSDTNFFTNFLGDIRDHGGIFVATYAALAVGTACEVALEFPGDLRADVRGVVRWRREATAEGNMVPGIGVEITHATDDGWRLIDRFVAKREPMIHDV